MAHFLKLEGKVVNTVSVSSLFCKGAVTVSGMSGDQLVIRII